MNLQELIKSFDNLPQIVKIILAIPALDIIWGSTVSSRAYATTTRPASFSVWFCCLSVRRSCG